MTLTTMTMIQNIFSLLLFAKNPSITSVERINPIESVTSKHIQCGKNIDPTKSIEQTKRNEAKWNSKDSNTGRTILSPAYRRTNTHFIIAYQNIIYASLKSSSLASSAPAVIAAINPANSANSSVPLPSRSIDANKIS